MLGLVLEVSPSFLPGSYLFPCLFSISYPRRLFTPELSLPGVTFGVLLGTYVCLCTVYWHMPVSLCKCAAVGIKLKAGSGQGILVATLSCRIFGDEDGDVTDDKCL